MYRNSICKFFFLFLFVFCGRAFAQKTTIVPFFPEKIVMKPVCYNEAMVIDLRKDKSNIGYNAPFSLLTKNTLDSTLTAYLQTMIGQTNMRRDAKLVVALYDLTYKDGYYVSSFNLNADCYLGKNDTYQLLSSIDYFTETVSKRNIKDAMDDINLFVAERFLQLAQDTAQARGEILTLSQIAQGKDGLKASIPVCHDTPKRGIYLTFEEFKNNTPSITEFVQKNHYVDYVNEPEYYYASENHKKIWIKPTDVYAVYNGEKWYKSMKGGFVTLRRDNGDFYFNISQKGIVAHDFGMLGALANIRTKEKRIFDYICRIDLRTGQAHVIKRDLL